MEEATGGDTCLIRFLQQMCGYTLTGKTTEHALFFIYGAGGNGKSVFLNVLSAILGEYAATAAMDTFTASKYERHSTDLAMLKGARLVTASETEDGRMWAEARIKQMTGGDPITARYMRRDNFTYRPEFKLVITGNHKPRLNNVDDATRRRFNIIPFTRRPAVPDPKLEEALLAELPAIFRWAIDGCLDWQRAGLVRPAVVEDATRDYFDDQDVLGQWLAERCEIGSHFKETNRELFASWRQYAKAAGEDAGSAKAFGESMRKRGFEPFRTKYGRGFAGLRLIPCEPVSDPRIPDETGRDRCRMVTDGNRWVTDSIRDPSPASSCRYWVFLQRVTDVTDSSDMQRISRAHAHARARSASYGSSVTIRHPSPAEFLHWRDRRVRIGSASAKTDSALKPLGPTGARTPAVCATPRRSRCACPLEMNLLSTLEQVTSDESPRKSP